MMIVHQVACCKDCYDVAGDVWMNDQSPKTGPWMSVVAAHLRDHILPDHTFVSRGVLFWAPKLPTRLTVQGLVDRDDLNFVNR